MVARTNYCPNPSCKVNTTGWGGNSTFSRATTITPQPRSTGILFTGNGFSQTPNGACSSGDVFAVSFFITNNTSFSITGKTAYVSYTRSSGGDVFPETFSIPTMNVGETVRASFVTSAAPSLATNIYLIIDSINGSSGSGILIGSVQYEKVGTVAPYFDGDTTSAIWTGTAGNSTSVYNAGATASLFTTQTPSSGASDIFETSPVTVGIKFYVIKDGATLVGGNSYGPATVGVGTYELRAFEQSSADSGSGTGLLRTKQAYSTITPSAWNPLLFDGPIPLLKNKIYCLAMASSQGRYTAILNGFLSGQIVNGSIVGPQTNTDPVGSGNVYNGVFTSGLVNYPNNTFNGHAYMIDPIVEFPPPAFDPKAGAFLVFL